MTPAEGAFYLGLENMIMVRFANKPAPPFDQYHLSFLPLKRVVWSIVGDASTTTNDQRTDLDEVLRLAERFDNVTGAMMDDFFFPEKKLDGSIARHSSAEIRALARKLKGGKRPLDLWAVLYMHNLNHAKADLLPYIDSSDVLSLWTWLAKDLPRLDTELAKVDQLAPKTRKTLGCYMYDYGANKEIPVELMEFQCRKGLEWLQSGRIDGLIFLASCICDMGIPAVEWTRKWIADVGNTPLPENADGG